MIQIAFYHTFSMIQIVFYHTFSMIQIAFYHTFSMIQLNLSYPITTIYAEFNAIDNCNNYSIIICGYHTSLRNFQQINGKYE